jgi:predicted permease
MSIALLALFIPLALFFARLFFKEPYLRKIATYGLTFSNFAYMGNAVVAGVFGQKLFAEYLVFCLPIWLCVYLWGVPALLVPSERAVKKPKPTLKNRLQSFCNPMLVCTAIGILLGLTGLGAKLPTSILSVVDSAGACMSPIAMLLTGFAIGEIDLKKVFSRRVLYLFSAVKLLLFPLAFLLVFGFLPRTSFLSKNFLLCGACVASMPMGLNAIVIPAGYGKDTAEASAMTLVTHLFSVLTVPLFFALFQAFF